MGIVKLVKDDLLFDMPLYSIFMVVGDGWYVANKMKRTAKRFNFKEFSYLDVMNYANSIC